MRFAALAIVAFTVLIVGCAKRQPQETASFEIERSFEAKDAPVELTLKIDKRETTMADSFRCVVELRRGEDVTAQLPVYADLEQSFAPLLVRDRRALPQRIKNGFVVEADEYELEPLVSGEYTIKPFTPTYTLDGKEGTIETEPIELTVTSVGAGDPRAELRDIAGPVELPTKRARWWIWAGVGAVVIAAPAVVLILLLRRRRHPLAVARRLAAHEIAFDALRELREKDYIGRGMVNAFYVELSAILRWYVENRFGLHAPEQTTEEFLGAIAHDGHFDLRRRTLLGEFLEHCDLVKFAKYGPSAHEIEGAFTSATTFIDETKEEAADRAV